MPDERVGIVSLPLLNEEVDVSYYIQKWTLAMAGYSSIDAMRAAIAKEIPDDEDAAQARLEELLLKAENRVRTVLQYVDPTDELTFVYDNAPAASAAPTVDALPAEPVLPPDADVPEEPEEPETPADPDEPESPEEPEEPDEQPDTPDEPTVPEENTAVILPALNEDRPVFVGPEDEEETEK